MLLCLSYYCYYYVFNCTVLYDKGVISNLSFSLDTYYNRDRHKVIYFGGLPLSIFDFNILNTSNIKVPLVSSKPNLLPPFENA